MKYSVFSLHVLVITFFSCNNVKNSPSSISSIIYTHSTSNHRLVDLVFVRRNEMFDYAANHYDSIDLIMRVQLVEVSDDFFVNFYHEIKNLDDWSNWENTEKELQGHKIRIIKNDGLIETKRIPYTKDYINFFNKVLPTIIRDEKDAFIAQYFSLFTYPDLLRVNGNKIEKIPNIFMKYHSFNSIINSGHNVGYSSVFLSDNQLVDLSDYEMFGLLVHGDSLVKLFGESEISLYRKIEDKYELISSECPQVFRNCQ